MRCDYVILPSGKQVHYRTAGSGPLLVMLHPSPQNSEALIPAMETFSQVCTCIAFDLPGYGRSDGLAINEPDISDYATAILDAVGALGVKKFLLYGAATGAIVAIETAKRSPDRVHMALIDSYGHMSDEQRSEVLDGYMPDVTARRDGGHLFTYWDMCRHLFDMFPWHSGKASDRMKADLPPASVIHDVFLRYLQAGEGYAKAYLPAMHKEKRAHFDGLTVPTSFMRWQDSVVLNLTDAMIARDLPDCVTVLEAGPGMEARLSVQRDALRNFISSHSIDAAFDLDALPTVTHADIKRCYVEAGNWRLHGAKCDAGTGTPILFLHGAGASHRQMIQYAQPIVGAQPILMLDLPGHGNTVAPPEADLAHLDTNVDAISGLLCQYAGTGLEIVGTGLGGAVALALGGHKVVSKVTLIDPIPLSQEEMATHRKYGLPDMTPTHDGVHLARAWSMVKDQALFWPWFDYRASAKRKKDANLKPETLQAEAEDILRLAHRWRDVAELEVSLDWDALVAEAMAHCVLDIQTTDQHPCPERAERLRQTLTE